jgi:hypothetical protein
MSRGRMAQQLGRPMSADPSLSSMRIGNSTPYNGHAADEDIGLEKAMGGMYINQVCSLSYVVWSK